jgi:hypothetical protein
VRIEEVDGVLPTVAGKVAVVAVDHRQARAHVPRVLERCRDVRWTLERRRRARRRSARRARSPGRARWHGVRGVCEHTRADARRTRSSRRALEDARLASGLSIVVFGSWAREELTPESDDDWALLAAEPFDPADPAIREGMQAAETVLGTEKPLAGSASIAAANYAAQSSAPRQVPNRRA